MQPDSFIVFTAHYDHLGMMGDNTMFPGAHDNASGVAMALDLMKHYANPDNKPYYSVVFIATAAEELGILGSKYFCANPLFGLEKIKFLINLDMVSTGDEGIMVVNGAVFTEEYDKLVKINTEKSYLKAISKRGEAKNSDHWFFYRNGVKCFFIYTLGGVSEYHNIYDKPEALPYTEYNDIFKLLTDFVKTFN
jgi:Zn-dependent M28 family amino/carboxypeptidase